MNEIQRPNLAFNASTQSKFFESTVGKFFAMSQLATKLGMAYQYSTHGFDSIGRKYCCRETRLVSKGNAEWSGIW